MAGETEIADIVADRELHAEVKRLAPALARRAEPAGEAMVQAALEPLVLIYGIGNAARSPAFWQGYKILASVPAEALAKGVEDYLAAPDSQFFPKPGPLKALCDAHARPIFQAAHRAKLAAQAQPTKPIANRIAPEAMARLMTDFSAKMKNRPNPLHGRRPEKANTAGKPDAGGLTPQMRALLAKQRGEEGHPDG